MSEPIKKRSLARWERAMYQRVPNFIDLWTPTVFWLFGAVDLVFILLLTWYWKPALLLLIPWAYYILQGIFDLLQPYHAVLRNFPVLGHLRYFLESIRPEIRQYFVESDQEQNPFSRENRSVAYQRAKGAMDTMPFGTRQDVYDIGHEWINHSLLPVHVDPEGTRVLVGGPQCTTPYSAALFNISAMSFGSMSKNAILALNAGARRGHFYHNTGEGGISPYHLENGGDLTWQVGTGYFGCRTLDGNFDPVAFREKAALDSVRMIEIKLSQGAKPAHGGILPGAKVSREIADIRGVPIGKDVLSPPVHRAFDGAIGLLEFVGRLRELAGGKPIGFKLCVGNPVDFLGVVRAMLETEILPDFITVDGAEGGTGAAPIEFSNSVGMPLDDGLSLVHNALRGAGLRTRIRIVSAGKIATGFHVVRQLALGADLCNSARGMMFALGCIQALKCNTNTCPVGVATQDARLMRGLVVRDKAQRVFQFQRETVAAVCELTGAAGLTSTTHLRPYHIMRRVSRTEVLDLERIYELLPVGCLLNGSAPERWNRLWSLGEKRMRRTLADAVEPPRTARTARPGELGSDSPPGI